MTLLSFREERLRQAHSGLRGIWKTTTRLPFDRVLRHCRVVKDRRNISGAIKLRLFAASGGHCQKPDCLQALFPVEMGGDQHIAEMAHVIPHGAKGPRFEQRPEGEFDAESFENLILLCPSCHTIIDKDPDAFPRVLLLEWKASHQAKLADSQGIRRYDSREEVRRAIVTRMAENRAIWEKFAPVDGEEFEYDPESEAAMLWERRIRSVILPNHYRLQAIIEANSHLVTKKEQEVFALYKEHVRGLAERHICGESSKAIRFPTGMEHLFA